MSMQSYISAWDLHHPELLCTTRMGNICKVTMMDGRPAILKHLKSSAIEDEGMAGPLLEYYGGHGAVNVYNHDSGAQLIEYAPGRDLLHMMDDGITDEKATDIIADIVIKLHAPRKVTAPDGLTTLQERFDELFKTPDTDMPGKYVPIFLRASDLARKLVETKTPAIPLHGDLHHQNIVQSPRGWLAIDPKGLIGDAAYDVANVFCNPASHPIVKNDEKRIRRLSKTFSDALGQPEERILQYGAVHAALSGTWSLMGRRLKNAQERYQVASLMLDMTA